MIVNNPNITEKKYRKLAIQVGLDGISFCVSDTLSNRILTVREVTFELSNKKFSIEDHYALAFSNNPELNQDYDDVIVLHNNNLSTFVPQALFDEQYLGSYLQYGSKVFESDFFAFDSIEPYHINNVYVPFAHINNLLIDQFTNFDYRHISTNLTSCLLETSKNVDDKKMFIHFHGSHFEMIILQNQKLLLFNSFEFKTPEDFIYYVLFSAEQLNLNPEIFKLELLGSVTEEDPFFKIAYKFVRNVSLYDVSKLQQSNLFSEEENRKHYILFNA